MSAVRERIKDSDRAKKFWESLSSEQRWAIGDDLVLGTLDHLDWFGRKETAAFLNALDYHRMLWEDTVK